MSRKRQDVIVCPPLRYPITPLSYEFGGDHEIAVHVHPEHQLIYASRGVMTIAVDDITWVVPPQRAVWIPARTPHRVSIHGAVSMRTLYVKAQLVGFSRTCCVVGVSPLLRELILHACTYPGLKRGVKTHAHLIDLIIDQLNVLEVSTLQLVHPVDTRAARIAAVLATDPGDPRSLAAICAGAGASKRTIERIFQLETRMSLGQWRQQLRLVQSLPRLAAGQKVSQVAADLGYSTPSAFIAMFRKALGTTPRRYFSNTTPRGDA